MTSEYTVTHLGFPGKKALYTKKFGQNSKALRSVGRSRACSTEQAVCPQGRLRPSMEPKPRALHSLRGSLISKAGLSVQLDN